MLLWAKVVYYVAFLCIFLPSNCAKHWKGNKETSALL